MSKDRERMIREALLPGFAPSRIVIKDQSQLHAGHEGARDGKGHFDLVIVSERFAGVNHLQRHRMVYDALARLLQTDIHALRIKALTAAEYASGDQGAFNI